MDHSERRRHREKKKKLKQRRREYIRQEKITIKQQKKEIKEKREKWKKRRRRKWMKSLLHFINSFPKKSKEQDKLKKEKQKGKKRRKKYLSEERKSLSKERREMRLKTKPMRQKIRRARRKAFINNIISFIKHPVKIKKVKGAEKILRQQVRHDIRRLTIRKIYRFPFEVIESIGRFWKRRKIWLIHILKSISDFFSLIRYIHKYKEFRNSYLITSINSTTLFILAFLTVYFFYQYITILTASAFDIPAVLYSYRIFWPLYTYSTLYSRMALIVIFGSGPFICLIAGVVLYRLYILARFRFVYLKTFLLWASIHAVNMFFGAYIVGVITRTGFIYTTEWLFFSSIFDVEEIIFLITSIVIMLILGFHSTKQFLYASNSPKIIEPKIRFFYILSKVLIPWIFGNLVLYVMNIPNNPVELVFLYVTTVLIIIPVFTNYNSPSLQLLKLPKKTHKRIKICWAYLIITVIAIIVIRIILENGIRFS